MKRAVIYCRVSTEEQAKQGYSIDAQKKNCAEFAIQNGYSIVEMFVDEGCSAKDLNRPEVQKLLNYCKKQSNKVDAIIVWKLDRLSRFNTDYHGVIKPLIVAHNIQILSATESNINTIEGDFVRNIMMCNAEYELNLIRARTKSAMKEKAEEGHYPAKAPIGYKNVKDKNKKGKIVIDEENAFFVKRAFDLYLTGNYSFKRLGETLYKEGFCTKTGGKYPARKFEWMLHNIFYIGKFEWGGTIYEGKHKPIVSKEVFYGVQAMFKDVSRKRTHDITFPYTGLIKCTSCGCFLTAEMKRGAHKSGIYIYYHCSGSKGGDCKKKMIKQEILEDIFCQVIDDCHLPELFTENVLKEAKKKLFEFEEYKENTTDSIKDRIDRLNKRIKNSYIDKIEGNLPAGMSEQEWSKMFAEWHAEKDKLIMRLKEAEDTAKLVYDRIDLVLQFSNQLPMIFNTFDANRKKMILDILAEEITFDGKDIYVKLKPVFDEVRKLNLQSNPQSKNLNRTRQNAVIITKNDPQRAVFVNGAPNGSDLEPLIAVFLSLPLDFILVNNIKMCLVA